MSIAEGSPKLSRASTNLDHMKVSGSAAVLTWDSSEPATRSVSDNVDGTMETRASRNRLDACPCPIPNSAGKGSRNAQWFYLMQEACSLIWYAPAVFVRTRTSVDAQNRV